MSARLLGCPVLALGLATLAACSGSGERPMRVLFPDMFASLSYKAYDPHPTLARGQGIMPSHAAQVLPDDRWRVVLYLRGLQGAQAPARGATGAAPATSAAAPQDAAAGFGSR